MNENTLYDYSPDSPYALRPIDEDIFGTTRLYQPPLSEPLYECRLGWYYSPSRTTSKRTGQPLKKKPTYRYNTQKGLHLGRLSDVLGNLSQITYVDLLLNLNRDYVVFVPQELWAQYPNAQSWTKPQPHQQHDYVYTNPVPEYVAAVFIEEEARDCSLGKIDLNSPVEASVKSPVTVSPYTPGVTKPTLWKRFCNWLALEY